VQDFTDLDVDSVADANNVNEAMSWQFDPSGSGMTVLQVDLRPGAHADGTSATSDHRAEIYHGSPRDNGNHEVGWHILGFYLPPAFDAVRKETGVFQNHGACDPPPQNLMVYDGPDADGDLDDLAIGNKVMGQKRTLNYLGSSASGVWHYVAIHMRHSTAGDGFVQAWEADGALPDVSEPPTFARYGYDTVHDCAPNGSMPKIGLYDDDVNWGGTIYYCGYHRAADYTQASRLPNCPL
jgi:hypothetical protein